LTRRKEWFERLLNLTRSRSRTLVDLKGMLAPFISDKFSYDPEAVRQHLLQVELDRVLPLLKDDFLKLEDFFCRGIGKTLRERAEKKESKQPL